MLVLMVSEIPNLLTILDAADTECPRHVLDSRPYILDVGTLFLNDLKFSLRTLRHNPSFTLTAVAALALGIGATTAIFTVINTVIFQPLPYPNPGGGCASSNQVNPWTSLAFLSPSFVWRPSSSLCGAS